MRVYVAKVPWSCAIFLITPISNDCLIWLFGFAMMDFYCELASTYGFLLCVLVYCEWSGIYGLHTPVHLFHTVECCLS